MTTIKDVASHVGVSVGTVSRVLSDNHSVNPKIRDAVKAAIAELGYRPNMVARSLRQSRTNIIALIIPDITNPHFSQLALHIEAAASRAEHMVVVANTHSNVALERKQIGTLKSLFPAGFLIISADRDSRGEETGDIRTVAVDRPLGDHPLVSTDNHAGGYMAASHLLGLGHQRVAYVAGPRNLSVSEERKNGFFERYRLEIEAGTPGVSMPESIESQFDFSIGDPSLSALLLRNPATRPTAIATSNDQQAIAIMRMASDFGISIPRDISLIGFDDVPLAQLTTPRLTTIGQPVQAIAQAAVSALLETMPTSPVTLPPILQLRETTIRLA